MKKKVPARKPAKAMRARKAAAPARKPAKAVRARKAAAPARKPAATARKPAAAAHKAAAGAPATIPAVLPSGRRLLLVKKDLWEELRVVSPKGEIELAVELTPKGPVLRLRGVRLEIESTESVALRCKSFELRAEETMQLHAGGDLGVVCEGEIRMKSARQTFVDGDYVNLNCLERTGYHDDPATAPSEDPDKILPPGEDPDRTLPPGEPEQEP